MGFMMNYLGSTEKKWDDKDINSYFSKDEAQKFGELVDDKIGLFLKNFSQLLEQSNYKRTTNYLSDDLKYINDDFWRVRGAIRDITNDLLYVGNWRGVVNESTGLGGCTVYTPEKLVESLKHENQEFDKGPYRTCLPSLTKMPDGKLYESDFIYYKEATSKFEFKEKFDSLKNAISSLKADPELKMATLNLAKSIENDFYKSVSNPKELGENQNKDLRKHRVEGELSPKAQQNQINRKNLRIRKNEKEV